MNDLGSGPRRQDGEEVRKEDEPKRRHTALVSAVGNLDSILPGAAEELYRTYQRERSPRGNMCPATSSPLGEDPPRCQPSAL